MTSRVRDAERTFLGQHCALLTGDVIARVGEILLAFRMLQDCVRAGDADKVIVDAETENASRVLPRD